MTPTEVFTAPVAERIVWTLAHFLWQGSAIAALVFAVSWLIGGEMRKRYLVSVGGLLLMTLAPIATFLVITHAISPAPTPSSAIDDFGAFHAADFTTAWSTSDAIETSTAAQASRSAPLAPWVLAAWLTGVGVLSLRLTLGVFAVSWLKRSGRRAGEVVQQVARRLSKRMHVSLPQVRVSSRVAQAMVAGFWRPVIILPAAWLAQLPPDCLEAIIAHELAHIRRRDLWVNLLQRVVETLLFYHPAVWWLSLRLRHERELCCDELAVAATGRRVEYVSTLELVARRHAHVAPLLAAGIGGGRMALLHRVKHILGLSPAHDGVSPWTVGAAALVAAGGCWWIASGMNPLWADDNRDESTVVAQADGDGERKPEGERRDGAERKPEGDQPRDGDRPREGGDGDRPRERDKPREGDRPREGDQPRGPGEELRRHMQELKTRVNALRAEGKVDEAQAVERQIRETMEKFEKLHRPDRPQHEVPAEVREKAEQIKRQLGEARAAGNRELVADLERQLQEIIRAHHPHPQPEIPAEVREKAEQLKRQLGEARAAGRRDEVANLERQLQELIRAHHPMPPREGGLRPDAPIRPEIGGGDREMLQVIRELREEVGRLRREVDALKGGREGDRPRVEEPRRDGERRPDQPRREGDRPRPDGERREGDRPRPEGERREGDRPRPEGERRPDAPREGGDRRPEGERG